MEAITVSGHSIEPGDEVLVKTQPMRMWGHKPRVDEHAAPVEVKATVISVTFDRDFDEKKTFWGGLAAAQVPINGADNPAFRTIPISRENCRKV